MSRRLDIVELDGRAFGTDAGGGRGPRVAHFHGRPWLAVHWKCCHRYSRIYRNRQGTAYEGRCPRCGRVARAHVGPNGTNARFFTAE